MKTITKKSMLLLFVGLVLLNLSCKKKSSTAPADPRVPPKMELKIGTIYVSKDTTVVRQDTLLIGVIVTKTEDNLTSFNASVAYDGSTSTSSFYNHHLTSSEYGGYTVDVPYYVRNQAGTETLTFTIVDRDGNITKKTIVVTVL